MPPDNIETSKVTPKRYFFKAKSQIVLKSSKSSNNVRMQNKEKRMRKREKGYFPRN